MTGHLTLGTDKITLDATDGSAKFAGNVEVGDFDDTTGYKSICFWLTASIVEMIATLQSLFIKTAQQLVIRLLLLTPTAAPCLLLAVLMLDFQCELLNI